MAFMPSLKVHRAELLYKEIGAAMGRRASQEMGYMRASFLGGWLRKRAKNLAVHRRTSMIQAEFGTSIGKA
jgi:hypothetical protein